MSKVLLCKGEICPYSSKEGVCCLSCDKYKNKKYECPSYCIHIYLSEECEDIMVSKE